MPTIPLYFWQKKAILDTLPYIKIVFSCVLYYTIITTKQNQFSNKHGYAISSGYRCKYIVYKLSSSPSSSYSSHNLFRILLHILHQSLYFVLRLGYALLLFLLFLSPPPPPPLFPLPTPPPPYPPSNKSCKNGICKGHPSNNACNCKEIFWDRPEDRPTDKLSYRSA